MNQLNPKLDPKWKFQLEDSDKGLGSPIRGITFVEPHGFYALIDSNGRIWIEMKPGSGFFESPCRKLCLDLIRHHPQSHEFICSLEDF